MSDQTISQSSEQYSGILRQLGKNVNDYGEEKKEIRKMEIDSSRYGVSKPRRTIIRATIINDKKTL